MVAKGIKLKPILLRRSLYVLVPMEVAKLMGLTRETRLFLTLEHGDESALTYRMVKGNEEGS